jgi:glycerate kinase
VETWVTGPVSVAVPSHLGFIGEEKKTAVLDMAAAAELGLVPKKKMHVIQLLRQHMAWENLHERRWM